ncbi:MAG: ATP-binding protein [Nitrospinales bacterium]
MKFDLATIQFKSICLFLLLSLLPLCILGVVNFYASQKILKEKIEIGLKDLAVQMMDKIDRSLFNSIEDIKAWASIGAMQDVAAGDPEGRIAEVLIKLKKDYGVYSGIFCVDLNGKIIASSERETIGRDVSTETWFENAVKTSGIHIQGLEYSELVGGFAVVFSVPVFDSRDKTRAIGYLSSRFNWSELFEMTNSVHVTPEGQNEAGYALLIDNKGFVISGPGFILAEGNENAAENALSSINFLSLGYQSARFALEKRSGFIVETNPSGQEILVGYAGSQGYRDFEGFGWAVMILELTSKAFGPVFKLRRQSINIGLVVGLTAILLAVLVSRAISVPVRKLADLARAISRGDLSKTIPVRSKDEIGMLTRTFNQMTSDLRQVRKLERRNKDTLRNFVTIAAHDLQEPLRKIIVFGDCLKNSAALDNRGKDCLERMQRSAEKMQGFVRGLLELSKISSASNELRKANLNKIVSEVACDLEPRIAQLNGSLKVEELPTVEADKFQMRRLFQNLIDNALKFRKKGVPPRVHIASQVTAEGVWNIIVRDNGIGFDPKYLERILMPFQRLHSSNQYEGSGMGLAICQKIAETHGGQITAESKLGEGAAFIVTLPGNR